MNPATGENNKPGRLISLDALRGFDMFWIAGGSAVITGLATATGGPLTAILPQFEHVRWEGLHFFDLIWPLFMFIVGVSLPLSISKRRAEGSAKKELYLHAIKRALILFVIGMALQGGLLEWDLSKLHPCYSVLHGIAAGYLIAFIVTIECKPRVQAAITIVFLLAMWAMIMFVPIPGKGAGILTPDVNLATWFDQLVLGRFHHGENTWFLSYPGFGASVLLGVMAGHIISLKVSQRRRCLLLLLSGLGCIFTGLLWSFTFPVIKLMWTSSFVLLGGGFSFLMFSLFYWLTEIRGYTRWTFFFRVIGMNSITVYIMIMLFDFSMISNIFIGSLLPRTGNWAGFLSSAASLTVVWLILYLMYRKNTFLRL